MIVGEQCLECGRAMSYRIECRVTNYLESFDLETSEKYMTDKKRHDIGRVGGKIKKL